MTDWENTYLRGLSDRVRHIEDERKQVTEQMRELKAEAEKTGVRWDAFMMAHKIRTKLSPDAQLEWHHTFTSAAEQLSLFVEEG